MAVLATVVHLALPPLSILALGRFASRREFVWVVVPGGLVRRGSVAGSAVVLRSNHRGGVSSELGAAAEGGELLRIDRRPIQVGIPTPGTRFRPRAPAHRTALGAFILAILAACGCKSEKGARGFEAVRPTPPPTLEGGKTKLGEILAVSVIQGWGTPQLNRSVQGTPLSIGGQRYETGFGTHAVSRIEISFPAKYDAFTGSCGVDDEMNASGSVVCKVLDGNQVLFESPLLKGGMKAADFSVPTKGLTRLVLVVENGGDDITSDHADWVNLSLK